MQSQLIVYSLFDFWGLAGEGEGGRSFSSE